jgi:DNA helicase IV
VGQPPVDSDLPDEVATEIAAEQEHVDRVYARVEEATTSAGRVASEGHLRAQSDRIGQIRGEDATGLFERDVLVYAAARRIAELEAEHEGLVFGRLDSSKEPDQPLQKLYVGRLGVRDVEYEPLVIDWRAPAAEPFYRATPTDRHDVVRRRVLRCQGKVVVGLEDDLLAPELAPADLPVIGEGALMAALSRARGHTMRDIVATIQAEQDTAIRAPVRGVTVIGGGPGTGKTVVALHRAAYLLYADRRRFERGGVLVVGPSHAFMAYIERVLPSLGENTVSLRAVGELVDGMSAVEADPSDVAAVKGSLRMRGLLSRAVRDRVPGAPTALRVFVGGNAIELDPPALDAVRRTVLRRNKRNQALSEARRGLVSALWDRFPEELRSGRLADREVFADVVTDLPAFTSFLASWWPMLTPAEVLGWLGDARRVRRWARGELTDGEITLLSDAIRRSTAFTVADVALVDELQTVLGTPPPVSASSDEEDFDWLEGLTGSVGEVVTSSERRAAAAARADADEPDEYAHVLVDEAQDLSPMQWRMVTRRGPHASWTIVGDPAQSSWHDPAEARAAMDSMLGSLARHTFRLSTNYRNSAEIYRFAGEVIRREVPDADLPDAVRSTGTEPEHRVVDGELAEAARDATAELLDTVEGTVGVIAPPSLRTVVDKTHAELADPRIVTVTPLESKGLEYDAVVAVEPDRIVAETPGGVRALYVVLTRATQRLITVGTTTSWLPPTTT